MAKGAGCFGVRQLRTRVLDATGRLGVAVLVVVVIVASVAVADVATAMVSLHIMFACSRTDTELA